MLDNRIHIKHNPTSSTRNPKPNCKKKRRVKSHKHKTRDKASLEERWESLTANTETETQTDNSVQQQQVQGYLFLAKTEPDWSNRRSQKYNEAINQQSTSTEEASLKAISG
jgi:hypothetical protein